MLKVLTGRDWELLGVGFPVTAGDMKHRPLGPPRSPCSKSDFYEPFLVKGTSAARTGEQCATSWRRARRGSPRRAGRALRRSGVWSHSPDGTIEARSATGPGSGRPRHLMARDRDVTSPVGRKYTDAFGFDVLEENGNRRVTMGSYGIGVRVSSRCWRSSSPTTSWWPAGAPADVHVVIANKDEAAIGGAAILVDAPTRPGWRSC